jgi:hypothetical protein
MTVVANPLIEGVPVLIGDTVITSTDLRESSVPVPTVSVLPPMRRPITGFCRKVHIIEKRIAVAWTGSRLKAEQLIPSLRDHIQRHGASQRELGNFLSSYCFPTPGGVELRLVGWIAEDEPRPFWWSSLHSREIIYDEHDVEGSGSRVFSEAFSAKDAAFAGPGLTHEERVFLACLCGVSRLLTLETDQGLPLSQGFGFCYDIALWSKYRFKYISSYTQVNIDILYDSRTKSIQYNFKNPMLIYNSIGNSAAFWVVRHGAEQNPDDQSYNLQIDPVIIPSVAYKGKIDPPRPKFHSKFICAFLRIVDESRLTIVAPYCITDEAGPDVGMFLSKQGTLEILQLNMNAVVTTIRCAALRRQQARGDEERT